ncbi:MAG: divalent metal cation transporter [Alphaproteobacteria bacterium]|nr:divalent metal cation transporter [Alphaproteobacteria bacterium]
MGYERADLWLGIVLVIIGGVAMMAFAAATFAGHPEFGNFQDAGAVAAGLGKYAGHIAGVFFAVALIDASVIGAMAVSLSTAYTIGDVLSLRHSLHRKPKEAKAFYAVYGGLVVLAAALVLTPGTPLGLLTNAVQALAGVLLPSATVFLLLLCNDDAVLGPWVNGRWVNLFTGMVIAALVMLSIILTASVLFPDIGQRTIIAILAGGALFALAIAVTLLLVRREGRTIWTDSFGRMIWRMPPLHQLPPLRMTLLTRIWMIVLRGYLVVAGGLVLVRIVALATGAV